METVYKNALLLAMIMSYRGFEVAFRDRKIWVFIPDLIVEDLVIVELNACCESIKPN